MLRRVLAAALCCLCVSRVAAFSLTGTRWTAGSATLQLQLGSPATPLSDGAASWNVVADDAVALWNGYLANFRFAVVADSTAPRAQGNRINNVHFAGDIYGQAWGNGVLAVTLTFSSRASNTETDVLFNNRLNWDSYRGAQRFTAAGQPIYDFRRVALHEFGHALGLDHPDEEGQSVSALMNSRITALDTLTADDITGAQSLYGAATSTGPTTPTSPPTTPPSTVVAAPVITTHPASRTVTAGQSATFTVTAVSTAAVTYQWLKNGLAIGGAFGATYTIAGAAAADAGSYSVRVANSAGTVLSNAAFLTVLTSGTGGAAAPVIVTPPADVGVVAGSAFSLSVTASGSAPLAYQWRKDGAILPGVATASYTVAAADASHAGVYTVVVSNAAGSVTSPAATVTVGTLPLITTQPVGRTVDAGTRVTFAVAASGSPAPAFQWSRNNAAIPGATAASYTIDSVQPVHEGTYRVTATNPIGASTSVPATLAIAAPPVVTVPPAAVAVPNGGRAQFNVAATSASPIAYQWLRDGTAIAGATGAALVIDPARPADRGLYRVRLTNDAGSTLSPEAALTVRFSRLVNLSTRAFVPAGGALTPGFFVRGTGTKPLLLRAVGPTLAAFGVSDALRDTSLELVAQATGRTVAANANWNTVPGLAAAFAGVGAFPLTAGARDSALETRLAPAAYTARIAPGTAGLSGIALAEVYDTEANVGGTQLVNLSTLGFVGTGENALTAGFVVSGDAPKRVLVRAIGPGLAAFGVGDPLPDPQVGLVPLGRAEPLATNDDWPGNAELTAAFRAVAAFALTPGSKDSALVATLEPGAYTVVVSSVDGRTTGQALVEIYDLDP